MLFAGVLPHTRSMDNRLAPSAPEPDTIAGLVKLQRTFYGWKRETLAALAKVSLSTVERVERGETVRPANLEKLALALHQPHDAFTAMRVPLSPEEALASFVQSCSWMDGRVPVEVAPLRHQTQLRALSNTDAVLVASDLNGEDAACQISELREYLDLTSFVRAGDGILLPKRERSFRLRRLYKDVLALVAELERKHKAVCLAGTYEAQANTPGHDTIRVAVIAVRSRERNPSAANIKRLMAEKTVDMHAAMEVYFESIE